MGVSRVYGLQKQSLMNLQILDAFRRPSSHSIKYIGSISLTGLLHLDLVRAQVETRTSSENAVLQVRHKSWSNSQDIRITIENDIKVWCPDITNKEMRNALGETKRR